MSVARSNIVDMALRATSYFSGPRVIADARNVVRVIGGRRIVVYDGKPLYQLVDRSGVDIEGAVFPLEGRHNNGLSILGSMIVSQNDSRDIRTVAVSDVHGEAARMAQPLFEFPHAEKVLVNGDIVDRGPGWWTVYMALTSIPNLIYNWGNHDAMWFGAGVGNKALVAELFRWLFRYNEQELFAERFGINFDRLRTYALKNYGEALGHFKARVKVDGVEAGKAIEAALTEIKLKLEAQDRYKEPTSPLTQEERNILQALRHRNYIEQLSTAEKQLYDRLTAKKGFGLNKGQERELQSLESRSSELSQAEIEKLRTLREIQKEGNTLLAIIHRLKAGDRALSETENAIVDDLTEQLLNSPDFREMTLWFIENGGMYAIVDGNLYTHSHIPLDVQGQMRLIDGKEGKDLLDDITGRVKAVGEALRIFHEKGDRSALQAAEKDVRWMRFLAWEFDSPLYGRVMQTWERAYLQEESGTYAEPEDPFYELMEPKRPDPEDQKAMQRYAGVLAQGRRTLKAILTAFGLDPQKASLIKGHKPDKKDSLGHPIVNYGGQYLNIDCVMSGPAADIEEGYGVLLVTTSMGQLIEISLAPTRRTIIKDLPE